MLLDRRSRSQPAVDPVNKELSSHSEPASCPANLDESRLQNLPGCSSAVLPDYSSVTPLLSPGYSLQYPPAYSSQYPPEYSLLVEPGSGSQSFPRRVSVASLGLSSILLPSYSLLSLSPSTPECLLSGGSLSSIPHMLRDDQVRFRQEPSYRVIPYGPLSDDTINISKSEGDFIEKRFKLKNGISVVLVAVNSLRRFYPRDGPGPSNETQGWYYENPTNLPLKKSMAAVCLSLPFGCLDGMEDIGGLMHCLHHVVFRHIALPHLARGLRFLPSRHKDCNAFTWDSLSSFYFEVPFNDLVVALTLFARLFEKLPDLDQSLLDRVIEEVDNEYHETRSDDYVRTLEVLRRHEWERRFRQFPRGNLQSLRNIKDLGDRLCLQFNSRYLTSHMKLSVVSEITCYGMDALVEKTFENVRPRLGRSDVSRRLSSLKREVRSYRLYKIVPVKRRMTLSFHWTIEANHYHHKKIFNYLRYVVSHGSANGLLDELRQRLWAFEVSFDSRPDIIDHSAIVICVQLTGEGVKHVGEITSIVHQYLHMLRRTSPLPRIMTQLQQAAALQLNLQGVSLCSYAQHLTAAMHTRETQLHSSDTPTCRHTEPCYDLIMKDLNPNKCRIVYMNSMFEPKSFSNKEPWTGALYRMKKFSKKWNKLWKDDQRLQTRFKLPEHNRFLATRTAISHQRIDTALSTTVPRRPEGFDKQPVWLLRDPVFKWPGAAVCIVFSSEQLSDSIENAACATLLLSIFQKRMSYEASYSKMALLNYCLSISPKRIELQCSGLSQKLPLLLEIAIEKLTSLDCTERYFKCVRDIEVANMLNRLEDPRDLAEDVWRYLTQSGNYNPADRPAILKETKLDKYLQWSIELFKEMKVAAYVHDYSNLLKPANLLSNLIPRISASKTMAGRPTHGYVNKQKYIRILGVKPEITISFIKNYYILGKCKSYVYKLQMELLVMFINQYCHATLAIEKGLAYTVTCSLYHECEMYGFSIETMPPAEKFTLTEADTEIDDFVSAIASKVSQLRSTEFKALKHAYVEDTKKTTSRMDLNWVEISEFRNIRTEVPYGTHFLLSLELETFQNWVWEFIGMARHYLKKISIQVVGNGQKALLECQGGENIWRQRKSKARKAARNDKVGIQLIQPLNTLAFQHYITDLDSYRAELRHQAYDLGEKDIYFRHPPGFSASG